MKDIIMKPSNKHRLLLLLLLLLLPLLLSYSGAAASRNTITPSQPLAQDETLVSADEQYALGFFTPPDSTNRYVGLWYHKITEQTVLWIANRENPVLDSTSSCTLSLTPNGSLTISTHNNSKLVIWWSSPATTSSSTVEARLLDNGNLVVDNNNGEEYVWQSFHYLTDTWLPDMKVGVDPLIGLNTTLVSWRSDNDPSPGPYAVRMDTRGSPEFYLYKGSSIIWRTGPWDGVRFSGLTDMTSRMGFSFNFTNSNNQQVTYEYSVTNKSIASRLVLDHAGVIRRAVWLWDEKRWNFFWNAPKDDCDDYGRCGAYGSCDPDGSPICNCLQGFRPRNGDNWSLREWSDGCVRRTALDCRSGTTDGFAAVESIKLPDTRNCTVDMRLSVEECRGLCLRNCSCTAYASANVSGGGNGCVIWVGELRDVKAFDGDSGNGQDVMYVRLAAADLGTQRGQSHGSRNAIVPITVSLAAGIVIASCVGFLMWRRKRIRGTSISSQPTQVEVAKDDLDLPLFDFDTISVATNYFSAANKLGEGGFGPVYKGKLRDQEIAVKRLSKTSTQGIVEFKNEVLLIAKLQHRNLVRLLGCCVTREERMLAYEYMPNGSLDAFLFENSKGALLDWNTRYQIIEGIARGLLYLHHDSRFRIIHRDLKASNILLDKDMNPKISDFGMARIFGGDETGFNTRKVVGTYGYMSPEYAMDGIFSVKSDVFSFGVLVLEIISGKKNRGVYIVPPHINLVAHAWSLWKEGKSLQLVDELMSYPIPVDEVLRCTKIGLLCVQENPDDRPLMSYVIKMLCMDIASLPQPKQPGFAPRGPLGTESSSSNQGLSTSNNASITLLVGR